MDNEFEAIQQDWVNERNQPYLVNPWTLKQYDPTGKKANSPGAKLDAGKPSLYQGLIDYFPKALNEVAAVSTFGATKYTWKGWETVPDGYNRYSDALVRHLVAESEGPYDADSGLLHAAHTAWNALARLELKLKELYAVHT